MYHTVNKTTTYSNSGLCTATVIEAGPNNLFTMELVYPRFIHSELMTHRMFSRNASSSRATPVSRIISELEEDPVVPTEVYYNCKGMSGKDIVGPIEYEQFVTLWLDAADNAIDTAKRMEKLGIHKQTINRILEPFSYIRTIVTATEWDNFFDLRLSDKAQPEIRELAEAMKGAQDKAYELDMDRNGFEDDFWIFPYVNEDEAKDLNIIQQIKVSAARCARVSYMKSDNQTPASIEEDLALAERLLKDGHLTPFEHQVYYSSYNYGKWFYNLFGYQSARYIISENHLL